MTSVKNELRPYQEEIGRAILDSVDKRKGLTFSVMIARQGGKNEISAQVEATVLTAWAKVGGSAVKAAPTFSPQARISISRLKDLLDGAGGRAPMSSISVTSSDSGAPGRSSSALTLRATSSGRPPTSFLRSTKARTYHPRSTTVSSGPWERPAT